MVKIENITKKYKLIHHEVVALNNISLSFPSSGMFFIHGKSGCGKTSLLNVISGLDEYSSGNIIIDGKNVQKLSQSQLDNFRNLDISIIFQSYNLIPDLTVYQNIRIALEIQTWDNKTDREVKNRISEILDFVGLKGYEARKINELSGGEKQRIAIARAIIKDSKIILADEPTGNLDSNTGEMILKLLQKISTKCLVIIVSHDVTSAYTYGDQVITMSDGQIISIEENINNTQLITYRMTVKGSKHGLPEIIQSEDKDFLFNKFNELLTSHELLKTGYYINLSANQLEPVLNKETPSNVPDNNRQNIRVKRLSLKRRVLFSFLFMRKKRFRLVTTIVLVAITLFLLLSSAFISNYDTNKVLSEYLNRYQPHFLIGIRQNSYVNDFYDENYFTIRSGKVLLTALSAIIGIENNIGYKSEAIITSDIFEDNYSLCSDVTIAFINGESYKLFNVSTGRLPINPSEVAITDYIAKKLGVSNNDIIYCYGVPLKITGILKTDYMEYCLERKLLYGSEDTYLEYYLKYRYNLIAINELFKTHHFDNKFSVFLPASNFLLSNLESKYIDISASSLMYGNVEMFNNLNLIAGRLPVKDNEAIVSEQFAKEYGLINDQFELLDAEVDYYFININEKKYNDCFIDLLNLAEFFKSGIKVVGVYSLDSSFNVDVMLSSNVYNKIIKEYDAYFFYDGYMLNCSQLDRYKPLLDKANLYKVILDEPAANQIYNFKKIINQILPILEILLILITLLTVISIINYITVSIRENSKNIGVLRALGVSKKDVSAIIIIESIVVYLFAAILSISIAITFILFVNRLHQNSLSQNLYNIVSWDYAITFIVYFTTFFFCVLSAYYPVMQMSKMYPIEVIRRNEG